jgi:tetratricopeptide (TPR) repeat protein
LTGEQEQALIKRPTQNAEAYQQYLSGMFYRQKGRTDDVRKALDYYNQAVTLDPNFALAWVGVATTTRSLTLRGAIQPEVGAPAVRSAVDKALQIDPTLADAHVALATIIHEEWDWAGAEREFRRAMELNPNLAEAHSSYATYLSTMGRQNDALSEIRRAQELDPLQISYRSTEGNILRRLRRYDDAITKLRSVIKLEPDFIAAHIFLAFTYTDKKMYPQAIAEYQNVVSLEGETSYTRSYMGYTLALMGRRDEALAILDRLRTNKQYVSPTDMATIYAGLGDKESALDSLQKGFDNHDSAMRNIKTGMFYDALRSDQRFIDIVRRMGLTP